MPQLDGLRAFAVAAVLLHHLFPIVQPVVGGFGGLLGVKLFFVLSGFLITRILLQARSSSTGRGSWQLAQQFYIRRCLRIFPLYYFVIAFALLVGVPEVRDEFWWLVTYTFNFRVATLGTWPGNIAHFWSLAVEEQFYLVWPWVILLLPLRAFVPLTVAMILLGPAYRLLAYAWGLNDIAFYAVTFSSLDALGCGALLAILSGGDDAMTARVRRSCRLYVLPIGLTLIAALHVIRAVSTIGHALHPIFLDTAVALVCTWLVSSASGGFAGPLGHLLNARPLRYCGRIAYGTYVYHLLLPGPIYELGVWLGVAWQSHGYLHGVVSTVATFIVASLSWRLMERPINALKDRFAYEHRAPVAGLPNTAAHKVALGAT